MKDIAIVSSLIVAIQLADSYLRYLPFSQKISATESRKLLKSLLICGIVSYLICFAMFWKFDLDAMTYKLALVFHFIPTFALTMKIVRRSILQHLFVFGMTLIWILINHSLIAILDVIFFETAPEHFIFITHSTMYIATSLILLPLARKCFVNLLPLENFFDDQPYGRYIVALPFIISSSVLILWIDGELFHSWQERISRIYLPFTFFIFYHYVLTANRQIHLTRRLKEQLAALEEYNLAMQSSQEQIKIFRHDMRHDYRLIYAMLEDGKLDEVLKHIKIQDRLLNSTSIKIYSHAPLVNAALSIYLQRAEQNGIRTSHKINLPKNFRTDEGELAILISNLLENAIRASLKQPIERREIRITLEHIEGQFILEVTNFFDFEIQFDEQGYPLTHESGHGIGMISLKKFVEIHEAQFDFSHKDGLVKIMIYWEDFPN